MHGEFGAISTADVDGISPDPVSGTLYGVHRRETGNGAGGRADQA